jgi:hypothetical protein
MSSREPFGLEAILRHIDKGHATVHGATVLARRYREIRKKVAGWCESAAKANARADRLAAEVARLRMSDEEREAIERSRECAIERSIYVSSRQQSRRHDEDAVLLGGLLARHANGGAA